MRFPAKTPPEGPETPLDSLHRQPESAPNWVGILSIRNSPLLFNTPGTGMSTIQTGTVRPVGQASMKVQTGLAPIKGSR
jgi:hypothetical protein